MKKIDIFKLSIVLLFTALVIILFRYSQIFNEYAQNGRYYLINEGSLIIDTRNGTVYSIYDNESKGNNAEKINNALPK
jgi:hypothetical protein